MLLFLCSRNHLVREPRHSFTVSFLCILMPAFPSRDFLIMPGGAAKPTAQRLRTAAAEVEP